MNALESIRAILPPEFKDFSTSPLYATDGHMLVRRAAVPPEQWKRLKNLRNESRTADAQKIRSILSSLMPAEHKLEVSEVRHPESAACPEVAVLSNGNGLKVYANARKLRWLTKWVGHTRITCYNNLTPIRLMKGSRIQAVLMPLHPDRFEEGGQ